MQRFFWIAVVLACLLSQNAFGQAIDEGLFGQQETRVREGFMLGFNGYFDIPGGDMADRFGNSARVGPSVLYKTKSNWIFGAKADFIFGGTVKGDSLLYNIKNNIGSFYSAGGQYVGLSITERGYCIGLQVGKFFPFSIRGKQEISFLTLTGAGFIQHKVSIYDRENTIPQLKHEYKKGYDRLVNGAYVEQFLGINFFGRSGLVNFYLGGNILVGFTQGRRNFIFDERRPGLEKRTDILFGLRGGFYIPLFKQNKNEEILFQ